MFFFFLSIKNTPELYIVVYNGMDVPTIGAIDLFTCDLWHTFSGQSGKLILHGFPWEFPSSFQFIIKMRSEVIITRDFHSLFYNRANTSNVIFFMQILHFKM